MTTQPTAPQPPDALDRMAKAACDAFEAEVGSEVHLPWEDVEDEDREVWRNVVRAAITASDVPVLIGDADTMQALRRVLRLVERGFRLVTADIEADLALIAAALPKENADAEG